MRHDLVMGEPGVPQGRWLAEASPTIRVRLADPAREFPLNEQEVAARLESGEGRVNWLSQCLPGSRVRA
jgi:hypothetical protein